MKERDCANCKHHSEDGCSKWDCEFEAKMPKGELISKADAIELLTEIVFDEPPYFDSETLCRLYAEEQINKLPSAEADGANLINRHDAVTVIREECWKCNNMINDDLFMRIMSLPTSRQTDCTEFIMWLVEVVLDDEDWELNAVAYGEVIARKLKKLGLLEVKDGYYIRHIENNTKESDLAYRPSAEAVQRGKRGRRMICDDCTWGDCESCPLDGDEYPTNSEIDMLGVGDR